MTTTTDNSPTTVTTSSQIAPPRTIMEALLQEPVIPHLNRDEALANMEEVRRQANAGRSPFAYLVNNHLEKIFNASFTSIVVFFLVGCLGLQKSFLLEVLGFSLMILSMCSVLFCLYVSNTIEEWHRCLLKEYPHSHWVPDEVRRVALMVFARCPGVHLYVCFFGPDPYLVAVREEYGEPVEEVFLCFWKNLPTAHLRRIRVF